MIKWGRGNWLQDKETKFDWAAISQKFKRNHQEIRLICSVYVYIFPDSKTFLKT